MMNLLQTTLLCTTALATVTVAQSQTPAEFSVPSTLPIGIVANPDGSLEADGRNFRVSYERDGTVLRTRNVADATREVGLALRLTEWSRGHDVHPVPVRDATQTGAEMVSYAHDSIIERYELTSTGIEQSFVIAERPAGDGDLVLGIIAQSATLQAPPTAAAHQALSFADGEGNTIRYGEAVVFSRGGSPLPIDTRYDGNGRIELIVPGDFLDNAHYPIVVDPAVGPPIAPFAANTPDSTPDVAYDPINEIVCIVWKREFTVNDVRIRAARYDRDGNLLAGLISLTGSSFNSWPTVSFASSNGSTRFVVAYTSSNGLRMQLMSSTSGGLVGSAQTLTTTTPGGIRDRRCAISTGGPRWVAVWDRTPNGTAEPTQIMAMAIQPPPGSTTAIFTFAEHVVESVATGYVRSPRTPRAHLYQSTPLLRICWERFYTFPTPGDTDIRTAYCAIGNSIAFLEGPENVPGASSVGAEEATPDIAMIDRGTVNRDYLLVWDDEGDILGQRYGSFGALGGQITIADSADIQRQPAVGAGFNEFSVGWLQAPASAPTTTDTIFGARVRLDGTVTTANGEIERIADWTHGGLRASSVVAEQSLFAPNEPNGVWFVWAAEDTSIGPIDDIRGRRFDPVRSTEFFFGSGCPGANGDIPVIGVNGDAYPGNLGFAIDVTDGPPSSIAVLMASHIIGTAPVPGAPGCTLYLGLPILDPILKVTDPAGNADVDLPIPNTIPAGSFLAFQWAFYTPGLNPFGWIASNDVDISWF